MSSNLTEDQSIKLKIIPKIIAKIIIDITITVAITLFDIVVITLKKSIMNIYLNNEMLDFYLNPTRFHFL